MTISENIPPNPDASTAPPSASPAWPFRAMACPSMTVAAAEGVPGIPSRMPDTEPPVMPPM